MLGFIAARRKGMKKEANRLRDRHKKPELLPEVREAIKVGAKRLLRVTVKLERSVSRRLPSRLSFRLPSAAPDVAAEGTPSSPPERPGKLRRQSTMMEPKPSKPPSGFFRYQWEFRTFYQNKWVQYFVAFLIMANFCANVIEKEIDPSGKKYPILFKSLEDMFNLIFLVELLVNAYGHWLRLFWCSSWNIFDFIVVIVGCISLSWFNIELPGPLSLLRTLRAFRVFRLFKRIPSLNKIIVALAAAIPGTLNAFIVLFLFVSIYAILGVEFFYDFGISPPRMTDGALTSDPHYLAYDPSDPTDRSYRPGSCWYYSLHRPWADPIDTTPWTASRHVLANATHLTTSGPREVLPALTNRGMCFGTEYFGTFFRSWISLFQVLSTESWAEAIGRPIAFHWPYNLPAAPLVAMSISFIFFFSYLLLTWLLLSNVVVSVLLDRFISAGIKDDQVHPHAPVHSQCVAQGHTPS